VLLHQRRDFAQFCRRESVVVLHSNWTQPELRCLPLALDVNMNRFASITGEEKEPVRTALQNRRAHSVILPAFGRRAKFEAIRLTASAAAALSIALAPTAPARVGRPGSHSGCGSHRLLTGPSHPTQDRRNDGATYATVNDLEQRIDHRPRQVCDLWCRSTQSPRTRPQRVSHFGVLCAKSFRITFPPFITKVTR
jgi:hypothetical protein